MDLVKAIETYKTADELQDYFRANPTEDVEEKRQRKDAVYHKRIVEKYDLDNKTVAQMDSIVGLSTGARAMSIISRIRSGKKVIEDAVKRKATFKDNYAAWVEVGEPDNWLQETNGKISIVTQEVD